LRCSYDCRSGAATIITVSNWQVDRHHLMPVTVQRAIETLLAIRSLESSVLDCMPIELMFEIFSFLDLNSDVAVE
jgi:hypothetical protein